MRPLMLSSCLFVYSFDRQGSIRMTAEPHDPSHCKLIPKVPVIDQFTMPDDTWRPGSRTPSLVKRYRLSI